jgi:Tfp pilus assembly protein PilX
MWADNALQEAEWSINNTTVYHYTQSFMHNKQHLVYGARAVKQHSTLQLSSAPDQSNQQAVELEVIKSIRRSMIN